MRLQKNRNLAFEKPGKFTWFWQTQTCASFVPFLSIESSSCHNYWQQISYWQNEVIFALNENDCFYVLHIIEHFLNWKLSRTIMRSVCKGRKCSNLSLYPWYVWVCMFPLKPGGIWLHSHDFICLSHLLISFVHLLIIYLNTPGKSIQVNWTTA